MVACAANKNNSRSKKMKPIHEDAASAPDNPIEEAIGMMRLHKGSATSYGETSAMVSEEQTFQEGNSRNQPQGWQ